MKPNYTQLGAAFGIVLMSAAECLDVYPRLPDPMATNFGGDGRPVVGPRRPCS